MPLHPAYPSATGTAGAAAVLIVAAFTLGASRTLCESLSAVALSIQTTRAGALSATLPEPNYTDSIPSAESVMLDQLVLDDATVQLEGTGSAPTLLVSCGGCDAAAFPHR